MKHLQESQGFTRTDSNSRLVYSYNARDNHPDVKVAQKSLVVRDNSNSIPENEEVSQTSKSSQEKSLPVHTLSTIVNLNSPTKGKKPTFVASSPSKHTKSTSIADKAAIFEISSPSKSIKDPALLSVSERKALFEKNKGEVLLPKAPFGMAPPVKVESIMKASSTKIISDNNSVINKSGIDKRNKHTDDKPDSVIPSSQVLTKVGNVKPVVHALLPKHTPQVVSERDSPTTALVHQAGGIASRVAALMQNKSTISEAQIEMNIKSQRQKEMDLLLNRFNRNKEVIDMN